jgi:hypothetical protein
MSEFKFPDELEEEKSVSSESGADEIEIEVVDDTPEADRGRKPLTKEVVDPTDDELSSYGDKVKSRIKELTHARHDERRAKESLMREKQELERIAQQIVAENQQLKQYVNTGTQQFQQQSMKLAENELDNARKQYKAAQEAFDADAILAAQEALLEAKMKVNAITNYRPPVQQERREEPRQQTYREPEPQLDAKTLRWQAKNQWFGHEEFEDVTSYALGLHKKLMSSGVDPQSDEYYEHIDARVRDKFPEVFGNEKPKESSRRPASVVAPAARSSGVKKVQMTNTAMALARKFGLTPQQYAAQVAKLESSNGNS